VTPPTASVEGVAHASGSSHCLGRGGGGRGDASPVLRGLGERLLLRVQRRPLCDDAARGLEGGRCQCRRGGSDGEGGRCFGGSLAGASSMGTEGQGPGRAGWPGGRRHGHEAAAGQPWIGSSGVITNGKKRASSQPSTPQAVRPWMARLASISAWHERRPRPCPPTCSLGSLVFGLLQRSIVLACRGVFLGLIGAGGVVG
jgi:hypothetical protein